MERLEGYTREMTRIRLTLQGDDLTNEIIKKGRILNPILILSLSLLI